MKKKIKRSVFNVKLDDYEQELSDALDRGELKSVDNLAEEIAFAKAAAANFLRKDQRVTLRISSWDLVRLKQKAASRGLPYQIFIANILHEYAMGYFKEITPAKFN